MGILLEDVVIRVFNLIDKLTLSGAWLVYRFVLLYVSVSVSVESATTTLLLMQWLANAVVKLGLACHRRKVRSVWKSLYFPSFYYVLQVLSSVLIVSRGLLLSFSKCEWEKDSAHQKRTLVKEDRVAHSNTRLKKEQNSISSHNLKQVTGYY